MKGRKEGKERKGKERKGKEGKKGKLSCFPAKVVFAPLCTKQRYLPPCTY
jgi:hypothetical protein